MSEPLKEAIIEFWQWCNTKGQAHKMSEGKLKQFEYALYSTPPLELCATCKKVVKTDAYLVFYAYLYGEMVPIRFTGAMKMGNRGITSKTPSYDNL